MYNCYNEAVRYLNNKYNGKYSKVDKEGKQVSIITHDDSIIKCLLGQYYFGIDAQRELYHKLLSMGIISAKEN